MIRGLISLDSRRVTHIFWKVLRDVGMDPLIQYQIVWLFNWIFVPIKFKYVPFLISGNVSVYGNVRQCTMRVPAAVPGSAR